MRTHVARTRRTHCSSRNGCAEFTPLFPRQFCAIAFIQQHVERVMRFHLGVHRHNAKCARITILCVARHKDALGYDATHVLIVALRVGWVFGSAHSKFQILHIARIRLPDQRIGRNQLELVHSTVQQNRFLCGMYHENARQQYCRPQRQRAKHFDCGSMNSFGFNDLFGWDRFRRNCVLQIQSEERKFIVSLLSILGKVFYEIAKWVLLRLIHKCKWHFTNGNHGRVSFAFYDLDKNTLLTLKLLWRSYDRWRQPIFTHSLPFNSFHNCVFSFISKSALFVSCEKKN